MPSERLDLSAGSVLHIEGFSSRGHPPKNKFVVILGQVSIDIALAFLISSQLHYLSMDSHKNEVVRVPANATTFLSRESIIQCFTLERLQVDLLNEDYETGKVKRRGRLSGQFVAKVKKTVEKSKLLTEREIHAILSVMKP